VAVVNRYRLPTHFSQDLHKVVIDMGVEGKLFLPGGVIAITEKAHAEKVGRVYTCIFG